MNKAAIMLIRHREHIDDSISDADIDKMYGQSLYGASAELELAVYPLKRAVIDALESMVRWMDSKLRRG